MLDLADLDHDSHSHGELGDFEQMAIPLGN